MKAGSKAVGEGRDAGTGNRDEEVKATGLHGQRAHFREEASVMPRLVALRA